MHTGASMVGHFFWCRLILVHVSESTSFHFFEIRRSIILVDFLITSIKCNSRWQINLPSGNFFLQFCFKSPQLYWGQAKNSSQRKKSLQKKFFAKKNIANKSPILHLFYRKIANIMKWKKCLLFWKKLLH